MNEDAIEEDVSKVKAALKNNLDCPDDHVARLQEAFRGDGMEADACCNSLGLLLSDHLRVVKDVETLKFDAEKSRTMQGVVNERTEARVRKLEEDVLNMGTLLVMQRSLTLRRLVLTLEDFIVKDSMSLLGLDEYDDPVSTLATYEGTFKNAVIRYRLFKKWINPRSNRSQFAMTEDEATVFEIKLKEVFGQGPKGTKEISAQFLKDEVTCVLNKLFNLGVLKENGLESAHPPLTEKSVNDAKYNGFPPTPQPSRMDANNFQALPQIYKGEVKDVNKKNVKIADDKACFEWGITVCNTIFPGVIEITPTK